MAPDDELLEERLKRMQPVGPPGALRQRVLMAAPANRASSSRRVWLTAAAVLIFAALLHWQTARDYAALAEPRATLEQQEHQRQVDLVATAWGGSAAARDAALVALEAIEDTSSTPDAERPTPGAVER